MTTQRTDPPIPPARRATDAGSTESVTTAQHGFHPLKVGAVGLAGVLFMAVANAAPITAMTGNVPIAVAYGNGTGAPAGYLVATVVLTLFTIGYVAMARHITTAGAFYGFISHGLGLMWGMASGFLATMAYIVFEASLIGIFAYFANSTVNAWFGWDVNWLIFALIAIVVIALFGYYDINVAAAVLGFFLICEVLLLGALSLTVLFKGGGPNGLMTQSINPANAFKSLPAGGGFGINAGTPPALLASGAAAIGLFFAFWSWVGFETTAVYGEESRDPKRIVPRATLIAVVGLGLFYTFVSWMVISGNGGKESINLAANDSIGMFVGLTKTQLGNWAGYVYQFLIVMGSFACALAFHNAAARYIYAIGREAPMLRDSLGATHHKHRSPHIASAAQSVITLLITLAFYFFVVGGHQPLQGAYIYLYGLMAILGTMAILIVQSICSLAVIWYFHVKKVHPGSALTTFAIPLLGGLGMIYVVFLLFDNLSFAGGGAAGSPLFHAIPLIVIATFAVGLLLAVWIRVRNPEGYRQIGRLVFEEAHERT